MIPPDDFTQLIAAHILNLKFTSLRLRQKIHIPETGGESGLKSSEPLGGKTRRRDEGLPANLRREEKFCDAAVSLIIDEIGDERYVRQIRLLAKRHLRDQENIFVLNPRCFRNFEC